MPLSASEASVEAEIKTKGFTAPRPCRTKGLLDRLTPDQLLAYRAYRGPEASGDQSLPKRKQEPADAA